jgi:hypothetical protein
MILLKFIVFVGTLLGIAVSGILFVLKFKKPDLTKGAKKVKQN